MIARRAITVRGTVQGVGFRPFVYRTARGLGLAGFVQNDADGVRIEVQGNDGALAGFVESLRRDAPQSASIRTVCVADLVVDDPLDRFEIRQSGASSSVRPTIPSDLAMCADCLCELTSPSDRRYGYPFTSCTRCGPRHSIVESLPYDRARTTMSVFALCAACRGEYEDPGDRRFHAEPIACWECGPSLRPGALEAAVETVAGGGIVALKGLGGYQLVADALSEAAIARLRDRKRREARPFAVMFPSLESLDAHAIVSPEEEALLTSPASPIVLLRRSEHCGLAAGVAPGNPFLGALLPTSPLHHRLVSAVRRPIVCTSGNVSEEPMVIDEGEARERLGEIADFFLDHDRRIVRPVDDSVARVTGRGVALLRRARGYAPRPLPRPEPGPVILALGAELKGTVALALADEVVLSQHLGDMGSVEGCKLLARTARDLLGMFGARPEAIGCDLHPDYASTKLAEQLASEYGVPLVRVQHHHAHVAAVLAEHGHLDAALGIAWDGTGYGSDGALWGGEALQCVGSGFRRVATLRASPLPGSEAAIREPRRTALGLLHECGLSEIARDWFTSSEMTALLSMLATGVRCPKTTSVGRLFDAVAAILGLHLRASFEGQAAMSVEHAAMAVRDDVGAYALPLRATEPATLDFAPLVAGILADRDRRVPAAVMAMRFHEALARGALAMARHADAATVAISGGCFQNAILTDRVIELLQADGRRVLWPRLVPPNDGAIAFGQLFVANRMLAEEGHVPGHSR